MDPKVSASDEISFLALGPADAFDALRGCLIQSGYTEQNVCNRLGLQDTSGFLSVRRPYQPAHPERDALDILINLFLAGGLVDYSTLSGAFSESTLNAMSSLGVLAEVVTDRKLWYSPMALYPTAGLYVVSDRWNALEHSIRKPDGSAFVYPGVSPETQLVLTSMAHSKCETFLDMCSGCGILALYAAANFASHAWALDINDSASRCAEFNRRLNNLDNMTVETSNLYSSVRLKRFDRIAANPPSMPSCRSWPVYEVGGPIGEGVTKQLIEGLPEHLAPGGSFCCVTVGFDKTSGEQFEDRIRNWLGQWGPEFDVCLTEQACHDTIRLAQKEAAKAGSSPDCLDELTRTFVRHSVEKFIDVLLIIERKAAGRLPKTVRSRRMDLAGNQV